jgi:hypothetical protein
MGIERAAMKCRQGPEESILAQCSIHGIKAEFDMGWGCCATPFKPPARPATMMVCPTELLCASAIFSIS